MRDEDSCPACLAADDDVLRALDDPKLVDPPDPQCTSAEGCRCMLFYVLLEEDPPPGGYKTE